MSKVFVPIEAADIQWRDGLPFCTQYKAIHSSATKTLKERQRIFLDGNNLLQRWKRPLKKYFIIGETSFGLGVNFLLACSQWLKDAPKATQLHFISYEKHPATQSDLIRSLALWPEFQKLGAELIAAYPILTPGFHHLSFAEGRIHLTLMLGDLQECFNQLLFCSDDHLERQLKRHSVDAWFFEGLTVPKSQRKNKDDLFCSIGLLSETGTTFAALSGAEEIYQQLRAVGFAVKGADQLTTIRAGHFTDLKSRVSQKRSTPWHVAVPRVVKSKRAIVIGAGLAGCYTAHALAKRGWQVILMDAQKEPGLGASGNIQAILYPKLSAYRSPFNDFMLSAFLFAYPVYSRWVKQHSLGCLSGLLQLTSHGNGLEAYPELAVRVNAQLASEIAGIHLDSEALFIPHAGWINSRAICHLLVQTPGVQWQSDTLIQELIYSHGVWQLADYSAEVVVIANGHSANQFAQTAHLPLQWTRGQMTYIAANADSQKLKVPLCGEAHILPAKNNLHAVGATYHQDFKESRCRSEEDAVNLMNLQKLKTPLHWSEAVRDHWMGIRVTTPDYLPLVGPAPHVAEFKERFASMRFDAKRWLPVPGCYYPGLFLCTAFGSRGLATIPLCAEWLADLISNQPHYWSRAMIQSLSPARFLRKQLIYDDRGLSDQK